MNSPLSTVYYIPLPANGGITPQDFVIRLINQLEKVYGLNKEPNHE